MTVLRQPPEKETFIVTLNRMGYMLARPDEYNQRFIDYTAHVKGPVLDIGAAYGLSTIPALLNNVTVYANDLSLTHLKILEQKVPPNLAHKLILKPGNVVTELKFKPETFDAILCSRVLHFIRPEFLKPTLLKIYRWLKPGGKFFFIMGSPFMGNFRGFLPIYNKRKIENHPWPGFIENTEPYIPERTHEVNAFINLIDDEQLATLLKEAGFKIEKLSYIPAADHAPKDYQLDGREHIGAIGVKE